ncbi:DUF5018 domain-containing protein [Sphingobacterium siyangense]|uniref:DUF5018 domain-containing protein n=1 Tax=Sphingobacterium siyangense TaxID=459529 RepID=UPI00301888C8
MDKIKFYNLWACAILLGGCQKPNYLERNVKNQLMDFYATIDGKGQDRLFLSTISNDTVYLHVDYYYPIDSDNEVDLSRLMLRASVPADAQVTPGLNGFTDLTAPKKITVTAGNGDAKDYVVIAEKKGNTDISGIKITFKDSEQKENEVEGILNGNTVTFYVVPGMDLSQSTLSYVINKHSSGSIASGAQVNLANGAEVPLTISGAGNIKRQLKLVVKEPVKLEKGVGINRRLFLKKAADLGFTANSETSCFVSGDYLVIVSRTSPSVFKVYNRFTGAYSHNLTNPFPAGRLIFQGVSDEKGRFMLGTYTPNGQSFVLYKYRDVFDTSPAKLLDLPYSKPAAVAAGDGNIGRKLNWVGDMDGNGQLLASVATSRYLLRWTVENGQIKSTAADVLEYKDGATSLGFLPEYLPLGVGANAELIASTNAELAYVSGSSWGRLAAFPAITGTAMNGGIAFQRFNNADILAQVKLFGSNEIGQMYVYDISDRARIGTTLSSPTYNQLRVYESELFTGGTNGNATSDICMGTSENGQRLQVYMLTTFGYLVAQEFTIYADSN